MAAGGSRPPRVVGEQTNMEAAALAARGRTAAIEWPSPIITDPTRAVFEIAADLAGCAAILEAAWRGSDSDAGSLNDALLLASRLMYRSSEALMAIETAIAEREGAAR